MEHLTPNERKAVLELKEALQEMLGNRLAGLYLFGSKARGDYSSDSDIDIAVIVRGLTKELKRAVFDKAADIELENDVYLSTLVLSEEEFELLKKRERRIALDIEREGVPLL
ncbi:MAG: nucleotidyltransferase domain-containing protein [Thermacetogeniaceae bacterium]